MPENVDLADVKKRLLSDAPPEPAAQPTQRAGMVDLGDVKARLLKETTLPEAQEPPPTAKEQELASRRGIVAQAVKSIPIAGPFADLAYSARLAYEQPANKSFMERFNQQAYEARRADEAYAAAHPGASLMANLAGGLLGYGGLAKIAPTAMGMVGPTVASRFYPATAAGAVIGAADARTRGEDVFQGAELGAAGAGLGPLVSGATRGTVSAIGNRILPRPNVLKNLSATSIGRLVGKLSEETPMSIAMARGRIGPSGIFADVSPGLTDLAGAISDKGGPAGAMIRDTYIKRANEQPLRVAQALTDAMGPAQNILESKQFITEARAAAADPLYELWRSSTVHPTPELKALIPRLEKSGAFDMAEKLSGISGRPINRNFFTTGPQKQYPTTEAWDYVKRGLDSSIDHAYANNDKTLAGELLNLKGQLISEIEKTSAGQIWKQARQSFASHSALLDQIDAGRDTLLGGRSGLSVDELKAELKHLTVPELQARIQGLRSAANEALGERIGADTGLRNKILAPNNQEKIKFMLGQKGQVLIDRMHGEREIAAKTTRVIPNYATGASNVTRSERLKELETPIFNPDLSHPLTWLPKSFSPLEALNTHIGLRIEKQYPELAKVLTTPEGPRLDRLLTSLQQEGGRRATVSAAMERPANALSLLISGPLQAQYRQAAARQKANQ